ncbi:acyl-CoA dehydrogenase family protein [Methylophilus sp.]|jgi:alkylation response protein AidB-like acyl-CoA dehydrogenase|uniref:acyl-CoA dehydrogenase family protein n=1 Tax=Methylophilus sp. TaxID=29541 RepID=UPI0011DB8933|nr:acyl-CoA dehydrogenase family protein [Methylophilus sp.]TXI45049.1 MAG: monooxygenase [Methylophilus sp.]
MTLALNSRLDDVEASHGVAFSGSIQEITQQLCDYLAQTAVERDAAGGTPYEQRQAVRDSGLLKLLIAKNDGGLGGNWQQIYSIIRQIARVDSSIAQVFAFQFLMLASIRLYGSESQWQQYFRLTAERNLWWGNALNPLDNRTIARKVTGGYVFSGQKSFCSGSMGSDYLIVSAIEEGSGKFLVAAVPTNRSGIHLNGDWDNIGQRQTDSGSAEFTQLRVDDSELLMQPGPLSSPFATVRSLVAQLIFTNIYLGIAEGALQEGAKYTRSSSRVWSGSLANTVHEDPFTLLHYGEFWASLHASAVLADHAANLLDAAWQQTLGLDEQTRGELALAVFSAKVNATRAGLDVTTRIFEVAGARATTAKLRMDRFWRNLRVYTLHDPVDYKLKDLGDWALNGQYPTPSFYA